MVNLHFIPNNILTKFFKELTKYKNDYQQYLNYTQELYYTFYCISLSVSMHMHVVTSQYIIIGEAERKSNQNSKLEFKFCVMCPKLFNLKDFYFLILESNVRSHHKYSSK